MYLVTLLLSIVSLDGLLPGATLFQRTSANPLIGEAVVAAEIGEFPFVVSLGLRIGGREHFCTGSLVTRTHVLTSAHCFDGVGRARNVRVLVGTNDLQAGGGRKFRLDSVDGWITHDAWSARNNVSLAYRENDIAIVTLFSEVDAGIPLGKLSTAKDEQHYGKSAVAVGWGTMKNGALPNLLQKAKFRVMNRSSCEDNMEALGYPRSHAQSNELCTTAVPPVMLGCGDSGGPLLIDGEIVGVNEAICPKDRPEHPKAFNIHASVDAHRDFIGIVTNMIV